MKTTTTLLALAMGCMTLTPSCSQIWDPTAQQQAEESVIAITVSSRIRNDTNKPKRENAYKEAVTILEEFIASGNTDSAELRRLLYAGFAKYLSPTYATLFSEEIVGAIVEMAASRDPEELLKAETTILTGIKAGIAMSDAETTPLVSGDTGK